MPKRNAGASGKSGGKVIGVPFEPKGELLLRRTFDAPRELVFKVWTDPKHVAEWWGPRGFKTTIHEMNVRPGGRWYYSMRAPDGKDYVFDGVYLDVAEPERLIFDGSIHGLPEQRVWTEVTFVESEGKTEIIVRQLFSFESDATRGAKIGWNQQMDRLSEFLASF
ncbi:MAG: SRPBCC domain-containing protein [Candidatus Acidiferrales bacterium]